MLHNPVFLKVDQPRDQSPVAWMHSNDPYLISKQEHILTQAQAFEKRNNQ